MRRIVSAEGILIALLLGLHLFIFTRGMGEEGWGSLANTVSLLEDRDLDLENNRMPLSGPPPGADEGASRPASMPATLPQEGPPSASETPGDPTEADVGPYQASPVDQDHVVTREPLGPSFFDIPFVWVANRWFSSRQIQVEDKDSVYARMESRQFVQVVAALASHGFWTVLAVLVLYAILRDLCVGRGDALMATLLIFASSSLTWYGSSGSSHGVSAFTLALALYAFVRLLLRIKEDARRGFCVDRCGGAARRRRQALPALFSSDRRIGVELSRLHLRPVGDHRLPWLRPFKGAILLARALGRG